MSDPTKIRGFRNVSTPRQAVFITEGGEAKISQISPRHWKVLPRGGTAYEVSGKQEAIEEARGIASGLSPSHIRELQEKQRRLQSNLLAEPLKKSSSQIKREIDEVLARKSGRSNSATSSSERSALDSASAFYGVRRDKLYAVPKTQPGSSERKFHSTKRVLSHRYGAPSPDVVAAFTDMANNAEAYGAENLFLARRAEGYMGDPKEFRCSEIFTKRLPSYKYELLVDYIDEHRKHAHERLGRKLSTKEADWMQSEAAKIRDAEKAVAVV